MTTSDDSFIEDVTSTYVRTKTLGAMEEMEQLKKEFYLVVVKSIKVIGSRRTRTDD